VDRQKAIREFFRGATHKIGFEVLVKPLLATVPGLAVAYLASFLPFLNQYSEPKLVAGIIGGTVVLVLYIGYRISMWGINTHRIRQNSGIFYYRRNDSDTDRTKNASFLEERITSATHIDIIGATGYKTFAHQDSTSRAVLRDLLSNSSAEIKILLLHPDSAEAASRAQALGVPLATYRSEILASIDFLKDLKSRDRGVALKLYSQRPIWKMIVADDFLWLQYYHPHLHVEKSPVYGISRSLVSGQYNLFDPFYAVFRKKWNYDGNPTYDFATGELVNSDNSRGPLRREVSQGPN